MARFSVKNPSKPGRKRYDVLGLGCTAVDDILYVAEYPVADAKIEVLSRERHCGGLTATALVAAARLGARCAFAGTLGHDVESQFVMESLAREGIDTNHTVRRTGARPVRSVIIVDQSRRTRNIFYEAKSAFGADLRLPTKDLILGTRVLLVDRFGIPGMIRAARLARANGIPVVGDFESSHMPRFGELLDLVDHLILSEGFARRITGTRSTAAALRKLWNERRSLVVATCGTNGCCFVDGTKRRPEHFPAFPVTAVDTTGCGDVFHGAYAAALARGLPTQERLRIASASAALKATKRGGQDGIPTERELRRFLEGTSSPAQRVTRP